MLPASVLAVSTLLKHSGLAALPCWKHLNPQSFTQTFQLKRPEKLGFFVFVIRFLPGKWVLHRGVNYIGDVGSECDQPSLDMRPPGSISIKDYAIETPLEISSASTVGETFYEVKIKIAVNINSSIAAINFVLKHEESGYWYQHRGRDYKVPLLNYLEDKRNAVRTKKGLCIWPGTLGQLSAALLKPEVADFLKEKTLEDIASERYLFKAF